MTKLAVRVRRYLGRPEVGAGLMFVALAAATIKLWLVRFMSSPQGVAVPGTGLVLDERQPLFWTWTLVSLVVSTWLAILLLRGRPGRRALRRALLITVVHAVGAVRFYEPGMMLLSLLPLFALVPALLFTKETPPR